MLDSARPCLLCSPPRASLNLRRCACYTLATNTSYHNFVLLCLIFFLLQLCPLWSFSLYYNITTILTSTRYSSTFLITSLTSFCSVIIYKISSSNQLWHFPSIWSPRPPWSPWLPWSPWGGGVGNLGQNPIYLNLSFFNKMWILNAQNVCTPKRYLSVYNDLKS